MVSARKVIVGVMYVIIAVLLGYYGRVNAAKKPTGCPATGCPAGQSCVNNACVPNATGCPAAGCPAGQSCVNNACVATPAPTSCTTGAQCTTPGQFCYNGTCQGPSGTCATACVLPQRCVNSVCVTPVA